MSKGKHTPPPWLDRDGNWLHDPDRLLTSTENAWLMGTAAEMYELLANYSNKADWHERRKALLKRIENA